MTPLDDASKYDGQTPFENKAYRESMAMEKKTKARASVGTTLPLYLNKAGIADSFTIGETSYKVEKPSFPTILEFTLADGKKVAAPVVTARTLSSGKDGQTNHDLTILPDGTVYEAIFHGNSDIIEISRVSLPNTNGDRFPLWEGALTLSPDTMRSNKVTLRPQPGINGEPSVTIHELTRDSSNADQADYLARKLADQILLNQFDTPAQVV